MKLAAAALSFLAVSAVAVPAAAAPAPSPLITSGRMCNNSGLGACIRDQGHDVIVQNYSSGAQTQFTVIDEPGGWYQLKNAATNRCLTWKAAVALFAMESCAVNNNTEFSNTASFAIQNRACTHNVVASSLADSAEDGCLGGQPPEPVNQWANKAS
jgi:hypothetical protein